MDNKSKAKFILRLLESIDDVAGIHEFALLPHVGLFFVIQREGKEDEIVWEGEKVKSFPKQTGYISTDQYMHDQFAKDVVSRYKEKDNHESDEEVWDWDDLPKIEGAKFYRGRVGYSFDTDVFDMTLPYELWKDKEVRVSVARKVSKVMGIPFDKVKIEVKTIGV